MFDRIRSYLRVRAVGADGGGNSDPEEDYSVRQGEPMFPLGRTTVTPAAQALLGRTATDVRDYLRQHVRGYWGHVGCAQWSENERAVQWGGRVVSFYSIYEEGFFIWSDVVGLRQEGKIDVDRMRTTVCTAEEFGL